MGRDKKTDRVKGNLKPSDSSRAAELLRAHSSTSGAGVPFLGFSQFAAVDSSSVDSIDSQLASTSLSGELSMIFRKLSKKDPVTKLKALEELVHEMNGMQGADEMAVLLPFWPKLYAKLSCDVDRRVRLQMNSAHALLVQTVRKQLAPYLKDLMTYWLLSMFDPVKEIAKMATACFNELFAEQKRAEVLIFCQENILKTLLDLLTVKTPETFSDPKQVTPEDMEAKYARMVSCGFYALSFLFKNLNQEQRMSSENGYMQLIDNDILWSRFTHSAPLIRKGCYHFMRSMCIHSKDTTSKLMDKIHSSFLVKSFSDKDITTHEEMWDALLVLSKNYPECWTSSQPDKKNVVLRSFMQFVRAAGYGSYQVTFPSLLVFISNIPFEQIEKYGAEKFYCDFFENWRRSLAQDFIGLAQFRVFMKHYADCATYMLLSQQDKALQEYLMNTALLPLLETSVLPSVDRELLDKWSFELVVDAWMTVMTKMLSSDMRIQTLSNFLKGSVFGCLESIIDGSKSMSDKERRESLKKCGAFLASLLRNSKSPQLSEYLLSVCSRVVALVCDRLLTEHIGEYCDGLISLLQFLLEEEKLVTCETRTALHPFIVKSVPRLLMILNANSFENVFTSVAWISARYVTSSEQNSALLSEVFDVSMGIGRYKSSIFLSDFLKFLVELKPNMKISADETKQMKSQVNSIVSGILSQEPIASEANLIASLLAFPSGIFLSDSEIRALFEKISVGGSINQKILNNASLILDHHANEWLQLFFQNLDSVISLSPDKSSTLLNELQYASRKENFPRDEFYRQSISRLVQSTREFNESLDELSHKHLLFFKHFVKEKDYPRVFQNWLEVLKWHEVAEKISNDAFDLTISITYPIALLIDDSKQHLPEHGSCNEDASVGARIFYLFYSVIQEIGLITLIENFTQHSEKLAAIDMLEFLIILYTHIQNQVSTESNCLWRETVEWDRVFRQASLDCRQTLRDFFDTWSFSKDLSYMDQIMQGSDIVPTVTRRLLTTESMYLELNTMLNFMFRDNNMNLSMAFNLVESLFEHPLLAISHTAILHSLQAFLTSEQKILLANEWAHQLQQENTILSKKGLLITLCIYECLSCNANFENVSSSFTIKIVQILVHEFKSICEQSNAVYLQAALILAKFIALNGLEHLDHHQQRLLLKLCNFAFEKDSETKVTPTVLANRYFGLQFFEALLSLRISDFANEELFEEYDQVLVPKISQRVLSWFTNLSRSNYSGEALGRFQELIARLIPKIPSSVITRDWPFDEILRLLRIQSFAVQKCAFSILRKLTKKQVKALTEAFDLARQDSELENSQSQLPQSLLEFMKSMPSLSFDEFKEHHDPIILHQIFGYFLAWLLLLDNFEYASYSLRAGFSEHLKTNEILPRLLFLIFDVLDYRSGAKRMFDLSRWDIESFMPEDMDMKQPFLAMPLLVSHIYWCCLTSIPAMVRSWYNEITSERQLSMAVIEYTDKFFSQSLINQEIQQLQVPSCQSLLGEAMSITTARNIVTAIYKIDDNVLEIRITLPNAYPLRQVDIQGIQRVGVSEDRWRRWLLNTSTSLTAQNNHIHDALLLFKQNAEKHFEGIEECAICYSIIGMLDRAIPNKACRVCKHKFHAGCLYKWFKSSNNSTCPLCRNLF